MSATSGPLDDSMAMNEYEPGKAIVDDSDGSKFLEKERDLENDMPLEEGKIVGQAETNDEGKTIEHATTKF